MNFTVWNHSRFETGVSRKMLNFWMVTKEVLWKYSIQSLKTTDSVWSSLFMRDNGICDIPQCLLAPGWADLSVNNASFLNSFPFRFGDGYTVIVRISGEFPDMEPVIQYFNTSFPNSILKEKHHNMLQYQLGSDVKLSAVFGQIEAVRDELNIEDYSVSQTTLDQVGSTGHL